VEEAVLVLVVMFAVAAIAGFLTVAASARWPAVDPARAVELAARGARRHPGRLVAFLRARTEPGTATGLGLTLALVGIIVGGTLLGVLAFLVRTSDTGLIGLDRGAAIWGAEHATSMTTLVVRAVTQLGGTPLIAPLAVVLTVGEYRRLPNRSLPVFVLLIVLGQVLIVNLIKVAVARIRPDIDPLASFSGASFPSGHTTAAASFAAGAALVLGRGRGPRERAMLAGAAVAIAVAVAASRVLLGVHWFSDVLAGLALGWSWFAILAIAFGGRLMRFGAPVEAAQAAATSEAGSQAGSPSDQRLAVSSASDRGYSADRRARSAWARDRRGIGGWDDHDDERTQQQGADRW